MQTIKSTDAAPAWAQAVRRLTDYLVLDFLGGPRPWKFSWVINFQKAGTFVFLLALMAWYDNFSAAAWVYTAMQGSYGLVWILKDVAFPDPNWQKRITIGGGINSFLGVLGWYWVFGWILISGVAQPDYPLPDFAWFCLCISLCIVGCAIMIAADAQKYFTLRVQRGLITDGMHRYIRHPNYLGEMMIWWSLWLFGLAADTAWATYAIAAPIAMTAMFLGFSIRRLDADRLQH